MNQDVNQIITDAKAYGKTVIQSAGTAANSVLDAAGQGVGTTVPKIENDALTVLLDFVPHDYRQIVTDFLKPLATGAEAKINQQITDQVAKAIAIAKTRIAAIVGGA